MGGDDDSKKRKQGGGGGGGGGKKFKYPGGGSTGTHHNSIIPRGTGSPGLLMTLVSGKEFMGAREIATVLGEHYERLTAKPSASKPAAADKGAVDISKELAAELSELKDRKAHFLEIINTDIRGTMYLRWNPENHAGETPPDMRAMVLSYFKDCAETKQTRSRWILRLFPSQVVCFAGLEDIRAAAAALIKSELPDVEGAAPGSLGPYSVVYDHRASPKDVKRDEVIKAVAESVPACYKVDLKSPVKVILVQVVKSSCCLAVIDDWLKYDRYNARRVAGLEDENGQEIKKEKAEAEEAKEEAANEDAE